MKYDVIIPVAKKDVGFLRKVLGYIRQNLVGADKVFVIANESCRSKITKLNLSEYGAIFVDENKLVPNLNYNRIKDILLSHNVHIRVGWYLQQFLKMGFALSSYSDGYYLTWDSDTLPLSKIDFFKNGKPLFTQKKEYHEEYFKTMKKILGIDKITDFSFIAEHMMFEKNIMVELIQKIENSTVDGEDWIEKILNACDNLEKPCFSEFETYGTYVEIFHPGVYGYQSLNTFRSAGIIKGRKIDEYRLNKMSIDLDTASFELFDKPVFPYAFSYYHHKWNRRWNQIKNRSLKDLFIFLKKKFQI